MIKISSYTPRFSALALGLATAMLLSAPAFAGAPAAPIAGCDSTVLDAMNKKANAVVAYDVATTEGISDAPKGSPRSGVNKPDSVLALTCFNSAAGNAASNIGQMFSGDFTTSIGGSGGGSGGASIIPDALSTEYLSFQGSIGSDTGIVSYTNTALDTNIDKCQDTTNTTTPTQALWNQAKDQGTPIKPYALFDDFVTGNEPSGLIGTTVSAGGTTGNTTSTGKSNFHNDWVQSKSDGDFDTNFGAADLILKNSAPNGSGTGAPKIPNFSTFFPMTGAPATAPTSCNIMVLADPGYTCPP